MKGLPLYNRNGQLFFIKPIFEPSTDDPFRASTSNEAASSAMRTPISLQTSRPGQKRNRNVANTTLIPRLVTTCTDDTARTLSISGDVGQVA